MSCRRCGGRQSFLDGSLTSGNSGGSPLIERIENLTKEVAALHCKFSARPYMGKDPFNANGDIDTAMGYSTDPAMVASTTVDNFADVFRGPEDFIGEPPQEFTSPSSADAKPSSKSGQAAGSFSVCFASGIFPRLASRSTKGPRSGSNAKGLQVEQSRRGGVSPGPARTFNRCDLCVASHRTMGHRAVRGVPVHGQIQIAPGGDSHSRDGEPGKF